jgi:hypothetical protein
MSGQETRNKLTDYWKESGVEKSDEFAFLPTSFIRFCPQGMQNCNSSGFSAVIRISKS